MKIKKINKKGWIKIIEAFMAIVLLLGFLMVLLVQINKNNQNNSLVEDNNLKILKGIETNQSLKSSALSTSIPSNSNETSGFPDDLKNYLGNSTFSGQNCLLYICEVEGECNLNNEIKEKEVYSSEVLIFSNLTYYSPRKLKVFCYDA